MFVLLGHQVSRRWLVVDADLETGLCGVRGAFAVPLMSKFNHIVPFVSALSAQEDYSTTLTACARKIYPCCFLTLCYIRGVGKADAGDWETFTFYGAGLEQTDAASTNTRHSSSVGRAAAL